MSSTRLLLSGFLAAIAVGGALLALPVSSAGDVIPLIDAFFTATSAVCVTGLSVVDLGTGFSRFGQGVVLLLVQVGGIGIMTLSTMLVMMAGQRISLSNQDAVAQRYTFSGGGRLGSLLKKVFLLTFFFELFGAAALFCAEVRHLPTAQSLWYAVFHSISAFCNAGFSLRQDSFIIYRDNAWVLSTLSLLILTGGIGFNVLSELLSGLNRRLRKLPVTVMTLHTRLSLSMTGVLLVFGIAGYIVLEHRETLYALSWPDRLLAGFFSSVTARTAGFNIVNYRALTIPTLILTMVLMLIGGCSGSAAGGIKANTLGVMLALARARYRGEEDVQLFNRTIPRALVTRATALTVFAVLMVIVASFALIVSEIGTVQYSETEGLGLGLLFETVSALGTVGLSTGLTPQLTPWGKALLMVLMYIGRVGPLTVAVAVSRARPKSAVRYVEEPVMIG